MLRTQRVIAKIVNIELEFQNQEKVLGTNLESVLTFVYNIFFFLKKKKKVKIQIPLPKYFHIRLKKGGARTKAFIFYITV